jgi:hypothetical protein
MTATLVVEAKRTFAPRDIPGMLPLLAKAIRALAGDTPVLVIAPWLSRRTREGLEEQGINYIDLTGNAYLLLTYPTLYIRTEGASRDPEPARRGPARVRGPKAGRLIRILTDVRPPYGVRELAAAADLAPGYVSRLLEALDRDALVERSPKGEVLSVDVRGLMRRWTETYEVFRSNKVHRFLAPTGAAKAVVELGTRVDLGPTVVTGSFAAMRLAPVAAPALLAVYCKDQSRLASSLGLLPSDQGANVVVLDPFDPIVWEMTTEADGVRYAAASQVAVDCLTGTGRMPAEGEAVLEWMLKDESAWRATSLREITLARGSAR